MRKIPYKKRKTTTTIYFVAQSKYSSFEETYHKARLKGNFDTGYHYYIDRQGNIIEDRHEEVVASSTFEDSTTSIYVLLETETKPTDCQKLSIKELLEILEDKYGTLEKIYK